VTSDRASAFSFAVGAARATPAASDAAKNSENPAEIAREPSMATSYRSRGRPRAAWRPGPKWPFLCCPSAIGSGSARRIVVVWPARGPFRRDKMAGKKTDGKKAGSISKSALVNAVVEETGDISRKQVKTVLEALADIAYKELKKS